MCDTINDGKAFGSSPVQKCRKFRPELRNSTVFKEEKEDRFSQLKPVLKRHCNKNGSAFGGGFVVAGNQNKLRKTVEGDHTKSQMNLKFDHLQIQEPFKPCKTSFPKNSNNGSTKHVLTNPTRESVQKINDSPQKLDPKLSIRVKPQAKNSEGLQRSMTMLALNKRADSPLKNCNSKQAGDHQLSNGSRQQKFAAMRTMSSIFDLPKQQPQKRLLRANLESSSQLTGGNILNHDVGPKPNTKKPSRRTAVQGKPNRGNYSEAMFATMTQVISAQNDEATNSRKYHQIHQSNIF